jgi:signal recognition particle receptor subunit beta
LPPERNSFRLPTRAAWTSSKQGAYMVQINFATREVNCKIVYYGPGRCGKTTNLQVVHAKAPQNSTGELVSIATEQDRTLYFDFLPLDLGSVAGMRTKFQLYTVPGQVYYDATRKLVLQGADGVVFVADSNPSMVQENIESLENLRSNLKENGLDLANLPIVLQYNKRDLPEVLTVEQMNEQLNWHNWPYVEAVAVNGDGVFQTLKQISQSVIRKLNEEQGYASDGAKKGGGGAFAKPAAPAAPPPPPGPGMMPGAAMPGAGGSGAPFHAQPSAGQGWQAAAAQAPGGGMPGGGMPGGGMPGGGRAGGGLPGAGTPFTPQQPATQGGGAPFSPQQPGMPGGGRPGGGTPFTPQQPAMQGGGSPYAPQQPGMPGGAYGGQPGGGAPFQQQQPGMQGGGQFPGQAGGGYGGGGQFPGQPGGGYGGGGQYQPQPGGMQGGGQFPGQPSGGYGGGMGGPTGSPSLRDLQQSGQPQGAQMGGGGMGGSPTGAPGMEGFQVIDPATSGEPASSGGSALVWVFLFILLLVGAAAGHYFKLYTIPGVPIPQVGGAQPSPPAAAPPAGADEKKAPDATKAP